MHEFNWFLLGGVAFCGMAFLFSYIPWRLTQDCKHEWNPWGQPTEDKQYRMCQKCLIVQKRDL